MTFTTTTIRELRALGLDQDTIEKVLEIFERARVSKPKKKAAERAARATRLPDDWSLPVEWRDWAIAIGLRAGEVAREATGFKNYWLNKPGDGGTKLRWDLTWQTWCRRTLERLGRQPIEPGASGAPAAASSGPETFTDETWKAIAKRYKSGAQWNATAWGPPPGRMDCLMPETFLQNNI